MLQGRARLNLWRERMQMLNPRASKILNKLFSENDYTSVAELATLTKSSNRSVRYNLQKIDQFLMKHRLPLLQRHNHKGVRLEKNQKTLQVLADYFSEESPYHKIYSREQIQQFILFHLLIHLKKFPISFFEVSLNLSRTAVLNHLAELRDRLTEKGLHLNWEKRKGVFVTGNEHTIILEFATLFCKRISITEFYNYIELGEKPSGFNGLLFRHLFIKKDLQYIRDLILLLEKELDCTYDDQSLLILFTYFHRLVSQAENKAVATEKMIPDERVEKEIHHIAGILLQKLRERYPQIPADERETTYLASMISSMKMVKHRQKWPENYSDFADQLIRSIERSYQICFSEHTSELKKMLLQHIVPMMNRIRFRITMENPLFAEIKHKHRRLFSNVKKACQEIGQAYGITINDQEVSYLTIYFATMMKKMEKNMEPPRILVVCIEGMAISKYLAASIMKLFNIKQVDTLPIREINDSIIRDYDFVITTVDMPNLDKNKVIRVNSILTQEDIQNLARSLHLNLNKHIQNHVAKVERLVEVIQESCEIRDLFKLQYGILLELLNDREKEIIQTENLRLNFSKENIKVRERVSNWKEAIFVGAGILLEKGFIEETYREKIIQNLEEYGPYMSVAPGVVLAHAGPGDGVMANALSVVTLEKGIDFHDRYSVPVSVIITLALKETRHQLNTVEKLIKLANNRHLVNCIIHASNPIEVYDLVTKTLQIREGE